MASDNLIHADWKRADFAKEHNELNAKYFKHGEQKKYKSFTELNVAMKVILDNSEATTMLEIGCGAAWHATYLKDEGAMSNIEYTGADISEHMLKYARQNYPDGSFLSIDATKDSLGKTFDIVAESATIELVSDHRALIRNMMSHSNEWLIFHRMFFKTDSSITSQVKTYGGAPDIRTHVGMNELNNILSEDGFSVFYKGTLSSEMVTIVARRAK